MPQGSTIIDKGAEALGIDSLIAVEMRSWLLKELGVDLPLLIIIGGNTMRQVLEACRARINPQMTPLLQASEGETATHKAQDSQEDAKVMTPSVQQSPATPANVAPTASDGTSKADAAERHGAEVTEPIIASEDVPSTSAQQQSSGEFPATTNTTHGANSVRISDSVCIGQKIPDASSTTGRHAPNQANSDHSSWDNDNNGSGLAQSIDMKSGAVNVRSVSGVSPGGSTQSQEKMKRKGLLGRLLRSRGFVRLRRYV
jgi:hypothetical protein